MEQKFKVGDKVKIVRINFATSGILITKDIGKTCKVTSVSVGGNIYILDNNHYGANFPESSLELAKGYKAPKPKKPTHIVVWDEGCGDPAQFFTSEPLAKTFIKELSEKSEVVKDSIIFAEVKNVKKVRISKQLNYKQHTI